MATEALAAATPRRPWSFLNRWLGAAGLSGRALVIAAPALWLTLFFLVPLAIVLQISVSLKQFGQPPYSSLLTFGDDGTVQLTLHLSNFLFLLSDSLYINAYLNSIKIAAISTAAALCIG
ncbi:MAG TPA: hypothetical protein GYA10_16610, partial [Alphaproteobacteria bacterium]|nr:hypothetical protein [Alphaproteobacteria bacterium]